jgi:translation initiation factor 1
MSKKKSNSNGIVYSTDPDFRTEEDSTPEETLLPKQQRLKVRLDTKHRSGKAVTS